MLYYIFHRSLLEIIFGHHILNIYLRHLFTKVCREYIILYYVILYHDCKIVILNVFPGIEGQQSLTFPSRAASWSSLL